MGYGGLQSFRGGFTMRPIVLGSGRPRAAPIGRNRQSLNASWPPPGHGECAFGDEAGFLELTPCHHQCVLHTNRLLYDESGARKKENFLLCDFRNGRHILTVLADSRDRCDDIAFLLCNPCALSRTREGSFNYNCTAAKHLRCMCDLKGKSAPEHTSVRRELSQTRDSTADNNFEIRGHFARPPKRLVHRLRPLTGIRTNCNQFIQAKQP